MTQYQEINYFVDGKPAKICLVDGVVVSEERAQEIILQNAANQKKEKPNQIILNRCGRYALIERKTQYKNEPRYIVACGYDEKTGEWNQGYYFGDKEDSQIEFQQLSSICAKCKHVDDGCTYCKI